MKSKVLKSAYRKHSLNIAIIYFRNIRVLIIGHLFRPLKPLWDSYSSSRDKQMALYRTADMMCTVTKSERLGKFKVGMGLLSEIANRKTCVIMLQPARPKGGKNKNCVDLWREADQD